MSTSTRPPLPSDEVARLLAFAHELADAAGAAILPHFRAALAVDNKAGPGGFDPVTVADREAETAMRERIRARFPAHAILGEEHGSDDGSPDSDGARLRWVLDPIDGTRGFMTGLPTWGTLIGLELDDRPLLGIMDQPFVGDRFIGSPDGAVMLRRNPGGGGATRVPLAVRSCAALEEAVVSTTSPDLFDAPELAAWTAIRRRARLARYGADCYAYCMLAAGLIDLVVESGLKPYDVVALIPLIERAGGVMTDWRGGPAREGGRIVAAGDPRLHEAALKLLDRAPAGT